MVCIQLGIKLFYLFISVLISCLLFYLPVTVVRVIGSSIDPSLIFLNFYCFFVISSSSLLFSAGCTLCSA